MKLPALVVFFLLLVSLSAFRSTGIELETKFLLGNRIELKIPKGFGIMPEEMAKLKYPAGRRPTLVYTNEAGTVSVALNLSSDRATQAELPTIKENLLRTYHNQYVGAREKWDALKVVNGRRVGFIEFGNLASNNTVYGTSADERSIYNLIFFTDVHGQLLLCTINCTGQNAEQWKLAAQEMMASLKVK